MRPVTDPIPADATVYEATERWLRPFPKRAFPVADDGTHRRAPSRSTRSRDDARPPVRSGPRWCRCRTRPKSVGRRRAARRRRRVDRPSDALACDDGGGTVGIIAVEDVEAWLKRRWNTGEFVEPTSVALPPRPDDRARRRCRRPGSSIRSMAAPSFAFDDDQNAVLAHGEGALLVTGGAGTGKTRGAAGTLRAPDRRRRRARADRAGARARAGPATPPRTALLERLPASLPGLQVLTVHGLAFRVLKTPRAASRPRCSGPPSSSRRCESCCRRRTRPHGPPTAACSRCAGSPTRCASCSPGCRSRCAPQRAGRGGATRPGSAAGPSSRASRRSTSTRSIRSIKLTMRGCVQLARRSTRAGGAPLFDHVLVDDYQDTTLAAEALLQRARRREHRRRRRPRGARVLVPGIDARAAAIGSRPRRSPAPRASSSRPTTEAPRASRCTAWVAPHTLRGARGDRARAPPRPRRGRRRRGASSR